MAHVFQVGAGSGGMPVLDLLCRDSRVSRVTLVEPDVYKPHNVERHLFPPADAGKFKAELARVRLQERCPNVQIDLLICDLLDPQKQGLIENAARACEIGVCAADNEAAKFHFDALMRKAQKPWTLGEVLSGGIGGFVHWFRTGGPCYGCVASHLKRPASADFIAVEKPKAPDYSQPGGPVPETTIPASKASIQTIASLHALITLGLLSDPAGYNPGFTSLLLTLERVPGVFEEPFKPYRFRVAQSPECLVCSLDVQPGPQTAEELDAALDQALARLPMSDLQPTYRITSAPQALHYSFEKAGLVLHDQPIPWSAEAVLVEGSLHLPTAGQRRPADYQLVIPGRECVTADAVRRQEGDQPHRLCVSFRLVPPAQTVTVALMWRGQELGRLELPVLSRAEFLDGLRLHLPTLYVRLGTESVACRTFVCNQCRGLLASALLTSPTSLAPITDFDLAVVFRSERDDAVQRVAARLSSTQLAGRQALFTAMPQKYPRKLGTWTASWLLGDRELARQEVKGISQRHFQKSLRVSGTRYVLQAADGSVALTRSLPTGGNSGRIGPCFLVCSREAGMAGLCGLRVEAQVSGAVRSPLLWEQEVLITDGPTVVAPGTLEPAELEQVHGFELAHAGRPMSLLPLQPAPSARFTSEGGFKPPPAFTWTSAADEELDQRLSRLLEERFRQG